MSHADDVAKRLAETQSSSTPARSDSRGRRAPIVSVRRHAGHEQSQVHHNADSEFASSGLAEQHVIIAHDVHNPRSERIRALSTELLLRQSGQPGAHMTALLSPCAREGRSLLAAELAVAFSQMGRSTLLVDADLRNPSQHQLFNLGSDTGLSRALDSGEEPCPFGVVGLPHLSVLPAGPELSNPLELLVKRQFELLLEEWRESYDFVVFDTAPVQDYADALAVASAVGQVVTLSRAQQTSYSQARGLLRRLAATDARILGAVINHF